MAFKSGFTPRATKVPKSSGSGNALINMMLAQQMLPQKKAVEGEAEIGLKQKQQAFQQEQVKTGAVPIRMKDPLTDVEYETEFGKPQMTEGIASGLRLGMSNAKQLEANIDKVLSSPYIKEHLGPLNIENHANMIGNLAMQLKGMQNSSNISEMAEFKGVTQQLFQAYRKYITGVQAGFPELQMLTPVMPEMTDPAPNYISKALGALDTIDRNYNTLLTHAKREGFRTIGFEGETNLPNPQDVRSRVQSQGINVGTGSSPIPGMNQQSQSQIGTIKVIRLSDGKRGTIKISDFNPQKYTKV